MTQQGRLPHLLGGSEKLPDLDEIWYTGLLYLLDDLFKLSFEIFCSGVILLGVTTTDLNEGFWIEMKFGLLIAYYISMGNAKADLKILNPEPQFPFSAAVEKGKGGV